MTIPYTSQGIRFFRVLCFCVLTLAASTQAAVVINEILYRPGTGYPMDAGMQWIELRNTSASSVDVGGWQFNKGVNFTFANGTTIPANGFLIVAADTVKFHAAFPSVTNYFGPWTGSLGSSNTIRIVDAFNVTVDEMTYYSDGDWATRFRETTYGGWAWGASGGKSIELRNPALPHTSGQNWGLSTATIGTPGAANTLASTNLAPLISSVAHSPVIPKSTDTVTITCQLTDDLLAPSSSSLTANLMWRDATTASPPAFQSVAMTNDGTGKFSATLPPKTNLTIVEFYVSASDGTNTRTWPAPTSEGQNANCQYQVDNEVLNTTDSYYRLILTAAENAAYESLAASNPNSNREFNQTLVVARPGTTGPEQIIRYSASMRIRGNSSRAYQFKPLRISWPSDNLWDGVSQFNCNPKASFLQYVGMKVWQSTGVAAPDGYPVELRRNGVEYTTSSGSTPDFGKWVRLETVGSDFLKGHFPGASSGNLYSIRRDTGEFYWRSGTPAPSDPNLEIDDWSKQNHGDANDWTDVTSFFTTWQTAAATHFPGAPAGNVQGGNWNNTPFTSAEITSVSTVADLDQWAKWFAMETILENQETGISNGIDDDYDVYFYPAANSQRRLQFIPHDMDTIFGLGDSPVAYNAVGLFDMSDNGSVFKPLLPLFGNNSNVGNDAFLTKYYFALQNIYSTVMDADTTSNPNPTLYATLDSLLTGWAPTATITQMKTFSTQRQAYLLGLINSPRWSLRGGTVSAGSTITLSVRSGQTGTIYYTVDGTDPRLYNSSNGTYSISPSAFVYSGPITIPNSRTISVRILNGSTWGALDQATFFVTQDFTKLVVTEINYNPPANGAVSGDELEFLELKNIGNVSIDLGGCSFTEGITYTFPVNTPLAPGGFCVLVRDVTAGQTNFHARYPGVTVGGVYSGKLSNSGEAITLIAPSSTIIFSFTYGDSPPWPISADGSGNSLVPKNTIYDSSDGTNWRASANIYGSPGTDDPAVITSVVINEVLTNSGPPLVDTIELYNPTNASVDVGNWWLSDDPSVPKKYRIPAPRVIPAGGYAVFDETQFNTTPGVFPSFALNSAGDDAYLFAGDANGNLTGYSHGFSFSGSELNVSFGRYINSAGDEHFPRQISRTFGSANSGPLVGPLVINEIMYHPYTGYDEFVEIRNISNASVPLYDPANPANTWKVSGIGYTFATSQSIPANGYALIVSIDPATFRTKYNVPGSVQIFGPYSGNLQGNGERVSLEMPDTPVTNIVNGLPVTVVPYDIIDTVRYTNLAPWPTAADGTGPSLQRTNSSAYGDDPANWFANGISAGFPNGIDQLPNISIASPANNSAYTAPATITFTSNASDPDGSVIKVEYFDGATKMGESTAAPTFSFAWISTSGTHTITAKATDNSLGTTISAPITIFVTTAVTPGLKGDFYNNKTLTAPIVGTRIDATVNFSTATSTWPTSYGFPSLTNTNFSVRWSGQIRAPKNGPVKFTTVANDGTRLYVNGSLVINNWIDVADNATATTNSADITFTLGQLYDIVLEYYQSTGPGSIILRWAGNGTPGVFIADVPQSVLYPDSVPIIITHPAGVAQTETLTVTAPAGATGSGNLPVTVTSALFSTTTVNVPLIQATHTTATKIAEAIVSALNSDPTVGARFTAYNSGALITLATKAEYLSSNDSTLNVAITAALGVSAVTTSTNGVAGVAPTLSKEQGTPVTFTVLASGHNLSYQWRKNGAFITGATSQSYTIPYLTPSDAAQYSVFVSNSYGFAISGNAQLSVTFTDTDGDGIQDWWETANGLNPNNAADASLDSDGDGMTNLQEFLAGTNPNDPNSKFSINSITKSVSPPGCTLSFTAQAYKSYTIQYKDTLSAPSWTTLQTYPTTSAQHTINYTDTATGYDSRFYRVTTP